MSCFGLLVLPIPEQLFLCMVASQFNAHLHNYLEVNSILPSENKHDGAFSVSTKAAIKTISYA